MLAGFQVNVEYSAYIWGTTKAHTNRQSLRLFKFQQHSRADMHHYSHTADRNIYQNAGSYGTGVWNGIEATLIPTALAIHVAIPPWVDI